MKIPIPIPIAVLALFVGAFPIRAQPQCPNERASNIAPHSGGDGEVRCQLGVVIFGVHIGINGGPCPKRIWFVPGHQECLGAEHSGTYCKFEGSIPITQQVCHCVEIGPSNFGISLPECVCEPTGNAGTVEDFQTVPCEST